MSFRGTLRAEESLFVGAFNPGEIPHFVRNDNEETFSANCEVCAARFEMFDPFRLRGAQSERGRSRAERNVHDGFEIDRLAALFGRLKFPLRQGFHGVGIKLRIHAMH